MILPCPVVKFDCCRTEKIRTLLLARTLILVLLELKSNFVEFLLLGMCGIVGYIGKKNAAPILMEGLRRESYRGYDSSGIIVLDNGQPVCVKAVGKLENLEKKIDSQDLRGNLGIGHCLPPDTLVQLADGRIIEISKIQNKDNILCLNPASLKFSTGKAKIIRHKSPKYLYEVQTPSISLQTTAEHKMLVFKDGAIGEKTVEEFLEGDILIVPKKIVIEKGEKIKFNDVFVKRYYQISQQVAQLIKEGLVEKELSRSKTAVLAGVSESYIEHIIKNDRNFREDQLQKILPLFSIEFSPENFIPQNSNHGKLLKLPKESSPELMQIIGYFLGDGYAGKRYLRFKDTDKETLKVYQRLIEKIFNIKGRIAPMKGTIAWVLEVNSLFLSNWFKENIISRKSEFLSNVGRLPLREIGAFLRGLFDAEGGVGVNAGQVFFGVTNKKLVKIVQFLLLRFGISASLSASERRRKNWKKAYKISLSNYNSIKNFLEWVGFSSYIKREKTESLLWGVQNMRKGGHRSCKIAPFLKKEIYKLCAGLIKNSSLRKFLGHNKNLNFFITEWNLIRFIEFLKKEALEKPAVQKIIDNLEKFLNGDIIFQQIIRKKKIKSPYLYLYDLQVDPYPNFIADCLVSHNCRWATHGGVTETNAHPHYDCQKNIFLVHNGIIENYKTLKEKLIQEGHKFTSATDTEVLCHLIEKFFNGNLEEAVIKALKLIKGTYGLAVIAKNDPYKIVAARNSSPLLIGVGDGEYLVASDPAGILERTKKVIYLSDNEVAVLTSNEMAIFDLEQNKKEKSIEKIEWNLEEAQKGGNPHFMLKEIMEQPESVANSLRGRLIIESGLAKLGGLEEVQEKLKRIKRINIVACGTAYHAGLVGEYMLEEYAGLPTEVDFASEFRYRKPVLTRKTAFLFISQSGETADTLGALREIKRKGGLALGIVNVVGSSLARETMAGVYNHAGPEIGVASTKAFTSQLAVLSLLTLFLARQRELSLVMGQRIAREISRIPELIKKILDNTRDIKNLAGKYKQAQNFLFIGRKYNYPIALEGALKLKEISYLHAEGCGAGEMKHGPLALIEENFPTMAICPSDSVYEKVVSNIEEIKARKGRVLAVATEGNEEIKKIVDDVIYIPKTLEMLTPILSVIPLQLFAYYMAVLKGNDPDYPRNLAKSVTTE